MSMTTEITTGAEPLPTSRRQSRQHQRSEDGLALMSASDCDLMTGVPMIARWYGYTLGEARAAIDRCEIIVFRKAGRRTIFALKSAQNQFWQELSGRPRTGSNPPACDNSNPSP